jgi:hypothetical protein
MRGSEEKKYKSGGAKELRFFVQVKKENFASRQTSSTLESSVENRMEKTQL